MDKDRPRQTGTDKNGGKREKKKKQENEGATWQRKNEKKNLEFILRKVRILAWEKVWTHLNFQKNLKFEIGNFELENFSEFGLEKT